MKGGDAMAGDTKAAQEGSKKWHKPVVLTCLVALPIAVLVVSCGGLLVMAGGLVGYHLWHTNPGPTPPELVAVSPASTEPIPPKITQVELPAAELPEQPDATRYQTNLA